LGKNKNPLQDTEIEYVEEDDLFGNLKKELPMQDFFEQRASERKKAKTSEESSQVRGRDARRILRSGHLHGILMRRFGTTTNEGHRRQRRRLGRRVIRLREREMRRTRKRMQGGVFSMSFSEGTESEWAKR